MLTPPPVLSSLSGERVLVFMLGSLGDTLVTLPALRALRESVGTGSLDLLSDDHGDSRVAPFDILAGEGLIDDFLRYPAGASRGTLAIARLARTLLRRRYDTVVSLLPSERPEASLRRDRLFFRFCGIRRLLGFESVAPPPPASGEPESEREGLLRLRRLARGPGDHGPWVADLLDRGYRLGVSTGELASADAYLRDAGIEGEGPLVGMAPGAKRASCRWPLVRFAELAGGLRQAVDARLVIVGGPGDEALADELLHAVPQARSAVGLFSVRKSAALLSRLALFVGNDTGTTHLATSVGTPTVAVFSEREPEGQWSPLGDRAVILRNRVPCRCCHSDVCPIEGHPCLTGISGARALQACLDQLARFAAVGVRGAVSETGTSEER